MLKILFFTFFKLGFYAFGGGYAMIPPVERALVEKHKIVEKETFDDMVSICGSLPGAVALNLAIFIGRRQAGIKGALVCAAACLLPSMIIVMAMLALFSQVAGSALVERMLRGIRPVVVGLIFYAASRLSRSAYPRKWYIAITVAAVAISLFLPQVPLPIMILAAIVLGVAGEFLTRKRGAPGDEDKS